MQTVVLFYKVEKKVIGENTNDLTLKIKRNISTAIKTLIQYFLHYFFQ
jgi:hypothetical protein